MADDYLTLTEVAQRLKVSIAAVRRWTLKGVKNRLGFLVFLQSEKVGGRYRTRELWVGDFIAACSGWDMDAADKPVRPGQKRWKDIARKTQEFPYDPEKGRREFEDKIAAKREMSLQKLRARGMKV